MFSIHATLIKNQHRHDSIRQLCYAVIGFLIIFLSPALSAAQPAQCQNNHYQILAPHPVTHDLAILLSQHSAIRVQRVAPERLPAGRQPSYFDGRGREPLRQAALKADAIITLRSIWPDDQSWPLARQSNIRIIEIDAATPIEGEPAGIALPQHEHAAILQHPWLNNANLVRMASLISNALIRLYPDQTDVVQKNMQHIQQRLHKLDAETAQALAKINNVSVLSLSEQLVFFANTLQLENHLWQADSKDNAEQQTKKLQQYLQQEQIRVVLHHKQPAAATVQAIQSADAKLIIINERDADPIETLEHATRAVLAAFNQAQQK